MVYTHRVFIAVSPVDIHFEIYFYISLFASVPFIILSLTSVLKDISDRFKKGCFVAFVLLVISAILFVMFYPVISGFVTDRAYVLNVLKWFDSWILCF